MTRVYPPLGPAAGLALASALFGLLAASASADQDLGARIAQDGNERGATACIQCHGEQGQGQSQPPFPRLAGLPEQYLVEQMEAYREGLRPNATMAQIAQNLDADEIEAISRYYAEMEPAGGPHDVPTDLVDKGREIALDGLSERNIQSCASCHGEEGRERNPSLPPLAGHPPQYLMAQLQAYAHGARETSLAGLMQGIVSELEEEEMAALAAYYASLPASDE
ncbi:cytochrome c class I [Thioalkalivibrio sp. K90mix]|uniref:c-type cytochrome n=1 Tax=unclassified Thioalkalivibrio TaxID=2621013 RepID=UPI000195A9A7|nr:MULTISPECIES: c-type cytochrome [unclassified Thioalkalivibrio]ADC71927.1 cytochrome c class I [Thioalkalivibrio sp. K90mix]